MRRAHDAYYTPAWQTRALLAHQEISGSVLEPCAGDGGIVRKLSQPLLEGRKINRIQYVTANDIAVGCCHEHIFDASRHDVYSLHGPFDWVITNPPYKMPLCMEIVANAVRHARVGVAMLLRLSFLEPTKVRGPWLAEHQPNRLIVLPRYSYTQNGSTDSVTTAWMIWLRRPLRADESAILSLYSASRRYAGEESPDLDDGHRGSTTKEAACGSTRRGT